MEPMESNLMNKSKYAWLDPRPFEINKEMDACLRSIDRKEWNAYKKNMMAQYLIEKEEFDGNLRKIEKSNEFKKIKEEKKASIQTQYVLCSLMIMMTGTMLIYFVNAIFRESYVINFSIDAIVGSVALVLFIRNEWLKYRITKACLNKKDYMLYDLLTLIFCILLKFFIYHFDVSLIIFIASYYFSKRRWTKEITQVFDGD